MSHEGRALPFRPGMTLMPGQSTSIDVRLPPEIGDRFVGFQVQEVPPPAQAPVQARARELGLPDGLRVDVQRHGQWRCGNCRSMMREKSEQVWVPDSVQRGDPAWSVTEAARRSAYNGGFTAWCVPCARKLGGGSVSRIVKAINGPALATAYPSNPFPLAFACTMLFAGLAAIILVLSWN